MDANWGGDINNINIITVEHFTRTYPTIEDGAYIGSGCNLVAPLKVNANSTIASGSTITEEVAGDTLTIARSRQVKIKNWKGPKSRK